MKDPSIETAPARKAVRAPRGLALSCKGWHQEAALRMLMNSFDPDIAEYPEELAIRSGTDKPSRDWTGYDAIVASLREIENDQTLLVQSGKPAGIFVTRPDAARVVITDAKLADWTCIGTQGALPGAYEIFLAAARAHFGGGLKGKFVVSGGMGRTGGAQPLAVTLLGGAFLGIDVDAESIKRRVKSGYCDVMVNDLDEALRILKNAVRKREPASVGLIGNCANVIPALAVRGVVPDLLTDQTAAQTAAHDPLNGYVPQNLTVAEAAELRRTNPDEYRRRALDSIAVHVRGMLDLQKLGAVALELGNGILTLAFQQGVADAHNIPGTISGYPHPQLSEGSGPLQWIALSGEASDIHRSDRLLQELFPEDEPLTQWIGFLKKRPRFQGLPARACWLARGERIKFGLALNDLVARGELRAPIVLSDNSSIEGSVTSAYAETETAPGGSNALGGRDFLKAILAGAYGASWISIGNGTDAKMHSVYAIVADGTLEMAARIERLFDRERGIARHQDADQDADEDADADQDADPNVGHTAKNP